MPPSNRPRDDELEAIRQRELRRLRHRRYMRREFAAAGLAVALGLGVMAGAAIIFKVSMLLAILVR